MFGLEYIQSSEILELRLLTELTSFSWSTKNNKPFAQKFKKISTQDSLNKITEIIRK